MVDVVIKPYDALPCHAQVFTINGKPADTGYFGSNQDTRSWEAEPYACACNEFIPSRNRKDMETAMKLYNITEADYYHIQEELESALYVGGCGWCV